MPTTTTTVSLTTTWTKIAAAKTYITVQKSGPNNIWLHLQSTTEGDPTGSGGLVLNDDHPSAEFSGIASTDDLWARSIRGNSAITIASADV